MNLNVKCEKKIREQPIIFPVYTQNFSGYSAQRCILPVSFPVDLLLHAIVVKPPERKLAKRTSVQCAKSFGGKQKKDWLSPNFF